MIKRLMWTMLVLGSIGSLWGADAFVGTWKMNVAKSTFAAGREVKEMTMTVSEQGDNALVAAVGSYRDGKPISTKYTVPIKGGTLNYSQGAPPAGTTIVAKRIDNNTIEFTVTMSGKQLAADRGVLSADGKTITLMRNGVDASGKPFKGTEVFNRQ